MPADGVFRPRSSDPAISTRTTDPRRRPNRRTVPARAANGLAALALAALVAGLAVGGPVRAVGSAATPPAAEDGAAGGALTVQVVDPTAIVETGETSGPPFLPLEGACFAAFPAGATPSDAVTGGCSDQDGVATIRGVPDGDFVLAQTTAPAGYRPMTNPIPFAMVEGQTYLMTVENVWFAEAIFRALGETGEALPGACVDVYAAARGQVGASVARACDADDGSADGATTVRHLPAGEYVAVETSAPPGYAPAPDQPLTVAGRSSFDFAVLHLPLPVGPATTSLAIYTVAEQGEPVAGACFALTGPTTVGPLCDNDAGDAAPLPGQIRIDELTGGEYVVEETMPPAGLDRADEATVEVAEGRIAEVVIVHEGAATPAATPSA